MGWLVHCGQDVGQAPVLARNMVVTEKSGRVGKVKLGRLQSLWAWPCSAANTCKLHATVAHDAS